LLEEAGVHYTPLGAAALKALVVAKFLLIGDAIRRVAQRQSRRLPVRIVTRLVWLLVILILLTTLAYLINKKFRGNDRWTTVVVLPMLLSPAVVGNFWTFLYQPQIGLFNYVVGFFTGKDPASFSMIADVTLAPWAIVVVDTWMWTPFVMLICLAGLRSIPDSIYEAAECDRRIGILKRCSRTPSN
jgi:ABC-type sugar transport system permease subunit